MRGNWGQSSSAKSEGGTVKEAERKIEQEVGKRAKVGDYSVARDNGRNKEIITKLKG